ncbi:sodium-dependent glucose transporter 1-like [Oppia nitens]|uniref:sodium-dependent glucose transporter 1-like n=1 Tax=Oppia nitens TaxID=1686743 RepID=UPI0023DA622F|nr:sodium-dependent glucose transporter 1-like [Oppia nitens]
MWAEKAAIYMCGNQIFFSLGIVLGPILSAPFVSKINLFTTIQPFGNNNTNQTSPMMAQTNIGVPFIILGAILFLAGSLLMAIYFYRPYISTVSLTNSDKVNGQLFSFKFKCPNKWHMIYVTLLVAIVGSYVGFMFMTLNLMPTYLEYTHHYMSPAGADRMVNIMTITILITAITNALLSIKFDSKIYIYINFTASFVANIILVFYGQYKLNTWSLWLAFILMGIGVSTLFPNMMAYAKQRMDIRNHTVGLVVAFIGLCSAVFPGLILNIIGPVLHDLTEQFNTTTDKITFIFMCFNFGYFVGALINGFIFNYLNRHLSIVAILIALAGFVAAFPYSPTLVIVFVMAFIVGYGCGGLDTGLVVWIIEMWSDQAGTYMAGYQLFYIVSVLIGPLMVTPFVTRYEPIVANLTGNDEPESYRQIHGNIGIPFIIVGALLLLMAVILLAIHIYRRYVPPPKQTLSISTLSSSVSQSLAPGVESPVSTLSSASPTLSSVLQNKQKSPITVKKVIYMTLFVLFMGIIVGIAYTTFNLLPTFMEYSHLNMAPEEADTMQTILSVTMLIYAIVYTLLSIKYWCYMKNLVYINWLMVLVGNIVLILFIYYQLGTWSIWLGYICLGIGHSTLYCSAITFVESHIKLSNRVTGLCVCVTGLCSAIFPVICGQFIKRAPVALPYMNMVLGTIGLTAFILLHVLLYRKNIYNFKSVLMS